MQCKEQRVRRCSVIFLLVLCVVDNMLNDDYINYFIIFFIFIVKPGELTVFNLSLYQSYKKHEIYVKEQI